MPTNQSRGTRLDSQGKIKVVGLQMGSVFGPVDSRRFGRSLGINPLPPDRKVCSFDCLYCECGRTDTLPNGIGWEQGLAWPRVEEILAQVEQALLSANRSGDRIDAITFAGNGEPTLYPDLLPLIRKLTPLRTALSPSSRLILLTNGSHLHSAPVRQAILHFDEVCFKLDAGTESLFRRINLPPLDTDFNHLVQSIAQFPEAVIQSLFVRGTVDNTVDEELEAWVRQLERIRPKWVDIYSLDRASPDPGLETVDLESLGKIAEYVRQRTGLRVSVY